MAGPYLWLREELGPAVREHREPLSVGLGAIGSQELACGWAGHLPYWQGFRVRTEQGMGCV